LPMRQHAPVRALSTRPPTGSQAKRGVLHPIGAKFAIRQRLANVDVVEMMWTKCGPNQA
jgi:hypothetical protein